MSEQNITDHKIKRALTATWDFISDTLVSAITVIGIVILIRFILVSPFEVNGGSMLDTLHDGDYIIVDKITYRFKEPERGDIIVLIPPTDTDTYYVKRIIGLPGEKIEFHDGTVLIHNERYPAGVKLKEEYLAERNKKSYLSGHTDRSIEIPEHQYFVMGDNRGGSNDSRHWGTLHERNIEGRAVLVVLPFKDMGFLEGVEYHL